MDHPFKQKMSFSLSSVTLYLFEKCVKLAIRYVRYPEVYVQYSTIGLHQIYNHAIPNGAVLYSRPISDPGLY